MFNIRLVPLIFSTLLAGAAQAVEEPRPDAYQAFNDGLARCTRLYGYSAEAGMKLGPHELGKGELDWRDCAYHVVRKTLVPGSRVPSVYEDAIKEDKAMTAAIQRQQLTRADRLEKLNDLLDSLRATEMLNAPGQAGKESAGRYLSPQEKEVFSQMFMPPRR